MINKGDNENKNPLHWAAEKGHLECVKLLLEAKADPNKGDKWDNSPLHMAANNGSAECIRLLLEAKADPNKGDNENRTPLHGAAEKGQAKCVKLLLEAKADPNKGDNKGHTAAYLAATNPINRKENLCLDLLIDEGHAVFLSKHAALLTEREKHIRAALFAVVGAVLGGSFYAYLVLGNNLTKSCDRFYGDVLLQPYLFDFMTVFVFKVV